MESDSDERGDREDNPIRFQICDGLKVYYKSMDAEYNYDFSVGCEENGIDDDGLNDDLSGEINEATVWDIDMFADDCSNFPIANADLDIDGRKEFIWNIILQCKNNKNPVFGKLPPLNQDAFEVTESEMDETKQMYKKQCPTLYNTGMENDQTFVKILTIGRKLKLDYLNNLVDDYFRARVNKIDEKTFSPDQWVKNIKHIRNLKTDEKKESPVALVKGAVKSFGARYYYFLFLFFILIAI